MRLLPAAVVDALSPRIINTHPAYLPEFPGAHGVRDALAAGVAETGASVIVVDNGVDSGPILAQERIPVLPGDNEHALHERIKPVERRLLIDVVSASPPSSTSHLRRTLARTSPHGRPQPRPSPVPRPRRRPGPPRARLGERQDRPARARRGARRRRASRSSRPARPPRPSATPGIAVTDVAAVTGFPESLDGRVKTLHPAVHAGLLADLRLEDHERQLAELGIAPFELVVVNLYPFVETVALGRRGRRRRRADRHRRTRDGARIGEELRERRDRRLAGVATRRSSTRSAPAAPRSPQRRELAAARSRTRRATTRRSPPGSPSVHRARRRGDLSPHLTIKAERPRDAALRRELAPARRRSTRASAGHGIAQATQLQGKEMSYNNYVDADAALRAAFDMVKPAVAIIKHANPCGIAVAPDALDPIASAHLRAHECDPVSAFGGVIAANRTVTLQMAENLRDIFTEVIVAPDFEPAALEVFRRRRTSACCSCPSDWQQERMDVRLVSGGLLLQDADRFPDDIESVAQTGSSSSGERPTTTSSPTSIFAWKACRAVKSNAILLAKDGASVGIGMGQVNRVDSCRLAVERAGDRAAGSVAASDAFFPFADGAAGAASTPASRRSCSPAVGARRRGHRRGAQPASRCSSPASGTSSTDERHQLAPSPLADPLS